MSIRRVLLSAVLAIHGIVMPVPRAEAADDWPTRPITMVVPLAAGGLVDSIGRILASSLSDTLGQSVVVENVGGAGGMIGAARVAKAAPDGYQFVVGSTGTHAQNQSIYKRPLYNAATDFAPVALLSQQTLLLVRKDLPASNLREFIAYAKANQSKMQYGSSGAGSPPHLACALLNATIGVDVANIPYRGFGPAIQDLIAGRIDYACPSPGIAIPLIESKHAKAIAVLSKERSPLLLDLPSAHEQGLADIDIDNWSAVFLPKGTPAAIVIKLNGAIATVLDMPSVQERLMTIGVSVAAREQRSPEHLQKYVESEIDKWSTIAKKAGLSAN